MKEPPRPRSQVTFQDCLWTVLWSDAEGRVCIQSTAGSECCVVSMGDLEQDNPAIMTEEVLDRILREAEEETSP